MRLATTYMIALAYYFAVANDYCTYHRVGRGAADSVSGKLQAS
jgi:hypothetical protein